MTASGSNSALVIFALYGLGVFILGWYAHKLLKKRKFLGEYYLGSRGLGPLALTLSYGATSASAGTFVGFPAFVYVHGWIVGLWIASYLIVPLCGMGILGKRINQLSRKTGAITLPDLLRARFESRASGLLSGGIIIFMLALYWRRFNTPGLLASMGAGLGAYLALYVADLATDEPFRLLGLHPLLWGFAASVLAGFATSLMTAPPPEQLVRRFFTAGEKSGTVKP